MFNELSGEVHLNLVDWRTIPKLLQMYKEQPSPELHEVLSVLDKISDTQKFTCLLCLKDMAGVGTNNASGSIGYVKIDETTAAAIALCPACMVTETKPLRERVVARFNELCPNVTHVWIHHYVGKEPLRET